MNWNRNSRRIILFSVSLPSITWLQLGRWKYIYSMWYKGRGNVIPALARSQLLYRPSCSVPAPLHTDMLRNYPADKQNLLAFVEFKESAPSSQKDIWVCHYIGLLSVKALDKVYIPLSSLCYLRRLGASRNVSGTQALTPLYTNEWCPFCLLLKPHKADRALYVMQAVQWTAYGKLQILIPRNISILDSYLLSSDVFHSNFSLISSSKTYA